MPLSSLFLIDYGFYGAVLNEKIVVNIRVYKPVKLITSDSLRRLNPLSRLERLVHIGPDTVLGG